MITKANFMPRTSNRYFKSKATDKPLPEVSCDVVDVGCFACEGIFLSSPSTAEGTTVAAVLEAETSAEGCISERNYKAPLLMSPMGRYLFALVTRVSNQKMETFRCSANDFEYRNLCDFSRRSFLTRNWSKDFMIRQSNLTSKK